MNWYRDVFRKMHFDMHTPEHVEEVAVEFDAEVLADRLAAIGVEAICWFAKCAYGWSYYPTRIGRRHPHLAADIFPAAVEACHARGIRVLGYYHVSGCQWALADHPEWHARQADGSVEGHMGINQMLCPLSPAGDELIMPQLVEIVTMQPADGLFLDDLIGWKTCYCDACREGFARAGGRPSPPRSPEEAGWDEFLAWRRDAAKEFLARAAAAVHEARPDALFGVNWAGSERLPDFLPAGLDYLTADIDETESSSLNASLVLRQWARRATPHDAMNSRMLHWWLDWTQKPVTAMQQEFATILANGGRTFLGDISYHRTAMPDPAILANAGEAFALARGIEPYVRGAEPVADLAILNSAQSHYRRSRATNSSPPAVKGAHLALLEAGLYAHILPEEDLPRVLSEYQALIVPEQQDLSEESLAAIRAFVQAGGGLVVIGDTPLWDVLGLEAIGPADGDRHYFTCDQDDLSPDDEVVCPPRLVHGRTMLARLRTAEMLAPHVAPLGSGAPHSGPPPDRPSGHPAVTINAFGAGRAAWVALPIMTDFYQRGHAALAPLLAGLVRRVCRPRLECEADAPVEATLLGREGRLLVHLVNYTASRHPSRPPTVARLAAVGPVTVRLRLPQEPLSVEGAPEAVQSRWDDGTLEVTVPRLGTWACVEVRLSS